MFAVLLCLLCFVFAVFVFAVSVFALCLLMRVFADGFLSAGQLSSLNFHHKQRCDLCLLCLLFFVFAE